MPFIQPLSDLHLEYYGKDWRKALPPVHPKADALALAGDIAIGEASLDAALALAQEHAVPVLWVPGNHEYYGSDPDSFRKLAEKRAGSLLANGVHCLGLTGPARVNGATFCGATLWTDFSLHVPSARFPDACAAMAIARARMPDFRHIRSAGGGPLSPEELLALHASERRRLFEELSSAGPNAVALTHHSPSLRSVSPRFAPQSAWLANPEPVAGENPYWLLNGCFSYDDPGLRSAAKLWIHGHCHESVDCSDGACRVYANPRGKPTRRQNAFENADWNPLALLSV